MVFMHIFPTHYLKRPCCIVALWAFLTWPSALFLKDSIFIGLILSDKPRTWNLCTDERLCPATHSPRPPSERLQANNFPLLLSLLCHILNQKLFQALWQGWGPVFRLWIWNPCNTFSFTFIKIYNKYIYLWIKSTCSQ